MKLNFNDDLTKKGIVSNEEKIISVDEMLLILKALGYDDNSTVSLENYSIDYDKRLGRGCVITCVDVEKVIRIGKYINDRGVSLKVSNVTSGVNTDYIYHIKNLGTYVELTKIGYILNCGNNMPRIAKYFDQSICGRYKEYEVRVGSYLFKCSFNLCDLNNGVIDNEDQLLEYINKLSFPIEDIFEVRECICNITGVYPNLRVTKDGILTAKIGLKNIEYEIEHDGYLFGCSFVLGVDGVIGNEEQLLEYFRTLKFPINNILEVHECICNITGICPNLQVTKAGVVTDKVEFGLSGDDMKYDIIITSGKEVITCTNAMTHYVNYFVPADKMDASHSILCLEVTRKDGKTTCGFTTNKQCDSSAIVEFASCSLMPNYWKGVNKLGGIEWWINERLGMHSAYIRNLYKGIDKA